MKGKKERREGQGARGGERGGEEKGRWVEETDRRGEKVEEWRWRESEEVIMMKKPDEGREKEEKRYDRMRNLGSYC